MFEEKGPFFHPLFFFSVCVTFSAGLVSILPKPRNRFELFGPWGSLHAFLSLEVIPYLHRSSTFFFFLLFFTLHEGKPHNVLTANPLSTNPSGKDAGRCDKRLKRYASDPSEYHLVRLHLAIHLPSRFPYHFTKTLGIFHLEKYIGMRKHPFFERNQ